MDYNDKTDLSGPRGGTPEVHVSDAPSEVGREARLSARVCPACGQTVDAEQSVCPRCGAAVAARPSVRTGVRSTPGQHVLLYAAVAVIVIAAVGAGLAFFLTAPAGFSGIRVLAPAGSCWNGAVGASGSMTSVHGCGSQDLPLACGGYVSGSVQKDDTSSWTLTVQILSHGIVVQQSSTSDPYGGVSVTGRC